MFISSYTYIFERYLGFVSNVTAFPCEYTVRFVFYNKDDICGYIVGCLVSFLGECNFGSSLTARFYINSQDLVLCSRRSSIIVQHSTSYFEFFRCTFVNDLSMVIKSFLFPFRILQKQGMFKKLLFL